MSQWTPIASRRSLMALASREVRRVLSLWAQTIAPPVVSGALMLAIFAGALSSKLREIEGVPYLIFILPGVLVMTVAGQSFANNATSVFQARNEGYIEDLLTSPLGPWSSVVAYMIGGVVRGMSAALIIAALALPFTDGFANWPMVLAVLLFTSVSFGALGVIVGMWADTFDRHAFIANLVIAPLALVAGVFYSARLLPAPWQTMTRLDPIYYLVDATRAGTADFHESSVIVSLVIAAAFAIGLTALAAVLYGRGWRIKP